MQASTLPSFINFKELFLQLNITEKFINFSLHFKIILYIINTIYNVYHTR